MIRSYLIGAVDRCFVIEMVWIRSRGRVDLCSEMGIEMGIKREQQIKKKRVERERERERECVCVCVCKEGS